MASMCVSLNIPVSKEDKKCRLKFYNTYQYGISELYIQFEMKFGDIQEISSWENMRL